MDGNAEGTTDRTITADELARGIDRHRLLNLEVLLLDMAHGRPAPRILSDVMEGHDRMEDMAVAPTGRDRRGERLAASRRASGMSVEAVARTLGVDAAEVTACEADPASHRDLSWRIKGVCSLAEAQRTGRLEETALMRRFDGVSITLALEPSGRLLFVVGNAVAEPFHDLARAQERARMRGRCRP